MIGKTVARGQFKPIETAPLTGKAIRLCLSDGFGTYGFEPAAWDRKKKKWVNAKTGTELKVKPIGWCHLNERERMERAAQETKNRANRIG